MQLRLRFDSPDAPLAQDKSSDAAAAALPSAATLEPIVFVRHRRARRYVLRVLADGTARVTVPRWGSRREAQAFAEANREWIAGQRARRRDRRAPAPRPLRPYVEAWFRRQAERHLPGQLMTLARVHGIEVAGVSVRDQRSRWGACSAKGRITLNWRLMAVPAFVREYVLLHELMHRRELNHSRRFWRLVRACCPRYQEARRWLRTEGQRLWPEHA